MRKTTLPVLLGRLLVAAAVLAAPAALRADSVKLKNGLTYTPALVVKADPAIESTNVSLVDAFRTVHFASTAGACYTEERPRIILRLGAVARNGSLVQRAGESFSSAEDFDVVLAREETAEEVAAALRAAGAVRVVISQVV